MLNSTDSAEAGYIREHRPVNGLYDNHLSIMGVKVLGDGALGSRGSALLITRRSGQSWFRYHFTDERFTNVMSPAYNNGYQIAYHAIGDDANHQVLNIHERLLKENPREDPRLRISTSRSLPRRILTGPWSSASSPRCSLPMPPRTYPWRRTAWARAYSDGLRLAHRSG